MNYIPYQYTYYIERYYNNDKNDICSTSSTNIYCIGKMGQLVDEIYQHSDSSYFITTI
jgi:hypothetical protein